MKIVAIIQARLGSSRLPRKVLMTIADKSMLEHVVNRVKKSKLTDEVLVATTTNVNDLAIIELCDLLGIKTFRGSEEDVLDRYYQAAKYSKADQVIRVTADCPIIDPKRIDEVVEYQLKTQADYTANTVIETFPDGQDCEIFTFSALKQSWLEAELSSEREHVTQYIKKHPEIFKIANVSYHQNLSAHRWTVDDREDLEFIRLIHAELYGANKFFTMEEVLEVLKRKPHLQKINAHIKRNEGLTKSLLKDEKAKK